MSTRETGTLAALTVELADVQARIERERDRLQEGCEHTHTYRTTGSCGGFMWMCARCFVEVHGWALYGLMEGDWERQVSQDEFYDKRPPGRLRTLGL